MNKEPQPLSDELRRERNAEVISSSLVSWFKSKNANEPAREGDFQFAAQLLESAIYDKRDDFQLFVRALDAPVNTCDIVGSVGSNLEISPSARGPLRPNTTFSLEVFRKVISPQQQGYTYGKSNVFVGTHLQYIELGDLARSIANGDAELFYELPLREKIRQEWDAIIIPHIPVDKRPDGEKILTDILDAYCEEGREYHNLKHIVDCLEKLEPYKDRDDYLQLWFALLMHDETYDSRIKADDELSNEELSAFGAGIYMEELGLPGADTVQRLIISTEKHEPTSEDERLLCSIDMSILAANESEYNRYATAIRDEYDWASEEEYAAGRIQALMTFDKPFTHTDFKDLNDKALDNIAREISLLSANAL